MAIPLLHCKLLPFNKAAVNKLKFIYNLLRTDNKTKSVTQKLCATRLIKKDKKDKKSAPIKYENVIKEKYKNSLRNKKSQS